MNIDFVAYMWIIGILLVLVSVIGYFVLVATLREYERRREDRMADARSRQVWDSESPGHYRRGTVQR